MIPLSQMMNKIIESRIFIKSFHLKKIPGSDSNGKHCFHTVSHIVILIVKSRPFAERWHALWFLAGGRAKNAFFLGSFPSPYTRAVPEFGQIRHWVEDPHPSEGPAGQADCSVPAAEIIT